jgi:hypothetical protein
VLPRLQAIDRLLLLLLLLSVHSHRVGHIVVLGRHLISKHAGVGAALAQLANDTRRHGHYGDTRLALLRHLYAHIHLCAALGVGRGLGGNAPHLLVDAGREDCLLHLTVGRGIAHNAGAGREAALLHEDTLLLLGVLELGLMVKLLLHCWLSPSIWDETLAAGHDAHVGVRTLRRLLLLLGRELLLELLLVLLLLLGAATIEIKHAPLCGHGTADM